MVINLLRTARTLIIAVAVAILGVLVFHLPLKESVIFCSCALVIIQIIRFECGAYDE